MMVPGPRAYASAATHFQNFAMQQCHARRVPRYSTYSYLLYGALDGHIICAQGAHNRMISLSVFDTEESPVEARADTLQLSVSASSNAMFAADTLHSATPVVDSATSSSSSATVNGSDGDGMAVDDGWGPRRSTRVRSSGLM